MSEHPQSAKSVAANRRSGTRKEQKILGRFYDQKFFAVRFQPSRALALPFPARPFNAMIHIAGDVDEKELHRLGLDLLRHGLRFALCHGQGASAMGAMLDSLIDEHGFGDNGLTAFTTVQEEEPLEEAVEYFILPADLAPTGLLVVVGNEAAFRGTMRAFTRATSHLRERIFRE